MDLNYNHAFWGVLFAGLFYVLGNAAWVNQWARQSRLIGVLLTVAMGVIVVVLAAMFDMRLDPELQSSVLDRISRVDGENHWIALTLFALLSAPGIAANLFSLDLRLTRLALILPAILIFIPMGKQLEHPDGDLMLFSVIATVATTAVLLMFQLLLDAEPVKKDKREATAA
ncbi:MAG: hypothetical protein AUK35_09920 [Zetaproteobacteria bacterium CG2_30_46_52]|nr:MAG: hypothetical protein AUK35_09920 [Zetaproteobacteria bacterium CG2_30_46_52]